MKHATLQSALLAVAVCAMISPSHADDKDRSLKLQKSSADKYPQKRPAKKPYFSSATISIFSSSRVDSNGRVASQSKVTGNASGNASVFGYANSNASALVQRYGRPEKSSDSSSARLRIEGDPDSYGSPLNEATSTVKITKNGIQISQSVDADEFGAVMKLDVLTRSEKIAVRERIKGSIRARVQPLQRNAKERVYSAADRDSLRKQNPRLVRRIEAFEKIVGTAKAAISKKGGFAEGKGQG